MSGWRRRPRCGLKFLLVGLVVVMVVAAGVVRVLEGGEGGAALHPSVDETFNALGPPHSFQASSTISDLKGPRVVVVGAGAGENLLERLLTGRSARREVVTLDMTHPASPAIPCLQTRTEPRYPVCPHPAAEDRHITARLSEEGSWQPRTLALLPVALANYPSSTVVDIGAHIGVFSLLGARLGAAVVAVEPVWASAVRFHAGASAGGVTRQVTLLLHAVTREPAQVKMKYKPGNLGGTSVVEVTPREADIIRKLRPHDLVNSITLDSLVPFINASSIILKIDIEGRECEALVGGHDLLTTHFAPYIFMEWAVMANNRHKYHSPCRPHHLQDMVGWLVSHGYHAHISRSGAALHPNKVESWRASDIYWRHSSALPLHPPVL